MRFVSFVRFIYRFSFIMFYDCTCFDVRQANEKLEPLIANQAKFSHSVTTSF